MVRSSVSPAHIVRAFQIAFQRARVSFPVLVFIWCMVNDLLVGQKSNNHKVPSEPGRLSSLIIPTMEDSPTKSSRDLYPVNAVFFHVPLTPDAETGVTFFWTQNFAKVFRGSVLSR